MVALCHGHMVSPVPGLGPTGRCTTENRAASRTLIGGLNPREIIMAPAQEETKHVFNSHKILMILLWNSPWNFRSTGGELQQLWHFSGLRTWEPHSHKLPVSEYPTLWITKNATNPGDCCDTMGGMCELRMPQASSKKNHQNYRNCLPKLSMRMFITDKHPHISGTLQQSNMAMDHLL